MVAIKNAISAVQYGISLMTALTSINIESYIGRRNHRKYRKYVYHFDKTLILFMTENICI